jgi:hypothetical protein
MTLSWRLTCIACFADITQAVCITWLDTGGADDTVRLWGQGDGSTNKGAPLGPKAGGYSCLGTYRTKSSAVLQVQYSRRNLLLAAGQFGLKHNKA